MGARRDAANAATALLSIVIANAPVSVGAQPLASGRVSLPYAATLAASGGTGTFAWSIASGGLPSGLTLDGATGVISGAPIAAGTYWASMTVSDPGDASNVATGSVTIVVGAKPLSLVTGPLPDGRVTLTYGAGFALAEGTATWAITLCSVG